jgi:tetratricopeptide (TPR) repeat protein
MDDAIAFLEDLAQQGGGQDLAAEIAVVRARLGNGDEEGALAYLDAFWPRIPTTSRCNSSRPPSGPAVGMFAEAEEGYRSLIEQRADVEDLWIGLIRALYAQGDIEGAEAALAEGLEALPQGLNLLWAQASFGSSRATTRARSSFTR